MNIVDLIAISGIAFFVICGVFNLRKVEGHD